MIPGLPKLGTGNWGSSMHPQDAQKQSLAELFEHAKAYTNVVMVTGYAGLFALWTVQSDQLTPATSLAVGLLLATSITAFVGWEIFGMLQRYASLSMLRKSVDNPGLAVEEMKRLPARSQLLMRRLERSFWPVISLAGGSAALAMLTLMSAFGHGLLLKFGPETFSKESAMEFNFLSLVLGGLIAGLVGFACLRVEAWRNGRRGRKALASALEADLRSSVELYEELANLWKAQETILYDLLDQLTFVRANYATDRPHLGLLGDDSIRNRLNLYFRKSYVTLNKLRDKQERIYRAPDAEAKAEIVQEITETLDELNDHRAEAAEIADQLSLRF